MTDAPREIWLQWNDYDPSEGVTWCKDKQHDDDIRYVRDEGWRPASDPPENSREVLVRDIFGRFHSDRYSLEQFGGWAYTHNSNVLDWSELPPLHDPLKEDK